MFRIITSLLFGKEEPAEGICSAEGDEEEWHVVSHQDAVGDEHLEGALIDHHSDSAVEASPVSQQEAATSVTSLESQNKSEADHGIVDQPPALGHLSLSSACVQKEKAFAQRHSTSRNAFQRQNRIREGFQQQTFHLQQPGRRSLCH